MKQQSYMKAKDVRHYVRLGARWDFICVVCGNGFETIACMSREHIIPRSRSKKKASKRDNLAASHHNCNNLKGNKSLMEAQRLLERKRLSMPAANFKQWLNKMIPNRIVPREALVPPELHPASGRRRGQPACFELPDRLPGMP